MGMFWRGEHTFAELHALGGDIGAYPPPKLTYYVDKEGGSDSHTGLGSWRNAKATYQAGVTAATCADNRYRDVDLIIAPAEYDEQVVVSGVAQGIYQGSSTSYAYRAGRLRIIHMGVASILKNSGVDTSHTLLIQRQKVELYGGTFRNYTDSGDFSAVCWERDTGIGDVIQGAMYGCRVEGRASAQIGIDVDAAQYVWIVDCWISGFDTGILIAGNGLGACTDNLVKHCMFRGNTNDILVGASSFTLLEDNIHYDPDTTLFVGDSDFSTRGGTIADLVVKGGMVHATDLAKMNATNIYHFGITTQDAVEW